MLSLWETVLQGSLAFLQVFDHRHWQLLFWTIFLRILGWETTWKDRDYVFHQMPGQSCLLSKVLKTLLPSPTDGKEWTGFLAALYSFSFLSLRFLRCDIVPLCAQPLPLASTHWVSEFWEAGVTDENMRLMFSWVIRSFVWPMRRVSSGSIQGTVAGYQLACKQSELSGRSQFLMLFSSIYNLSIFNSLNKFCTFLKVCPFPLELIACCKQVIFWL